jgi:hypothetical protein
MKRTAQELARIMRQAYPGAAGVALEAADMLDEQHSKIEAYKNVIRGYRQKELAENPTSPPQFGETDARIR